MWLGQTTCLSDATSKLTASLVIFHFYGNQRSNKRGIVKFCHVRVGNLADTRLVFLYLWISKQVGILSPWKDWPELSLKDTHLLLWVMYMLPVVARWSRWQEEFLLYPLASFGLRWATCVMSLAHTCLSSSLNPYMAEIRAGSFPSLFEENEVIGLPPWPLSWKTASW